MIEIESTTSIIVNCPVCERPSGGYFVPAGDFKVVKCPYCGLEYTLPKPSDEELNRFYENYNDIRAHSEIVSINARRNLELLKEYGLNDQSNILDFGCGNGEFMAVAGERCFGVELSARSKGERVFNDLDASPIDEYDFITLWGVLEHLNDPRGVVRRLKNKLRRGGQLVMVTVDAESVIPYYYKPPEHLTYWTPKSLHYLLESNGFKIRTIQAYEMCQLREIYVDRLLSRIPGEYKHAINPKNLPRIVTVPTNEVLVVAGRDW